MSKLAERHALMWGGQIRSWKYDKISARWTRQIVGPGRCHCGETSEWLDSDAARRRWHRQHKAEALAQAGGQ